MRTSLLSRLLLAATLCAACTSPEWAAQSRDASGITRVDRPAPEAGAFVDCTGAPDGTSCDDGNGCTRTDTCQAGVCTGSNPVVCVAGDLCHNAGTCDPTTGHCSNPTKPDGASCDFACTAGDTCLAGVCQPSPQPASLAPATGSPVGVGGTPISMAVGDLDGDGKVDLAVANFGSGNVTVLLGNGTGGFTQSARSPIAVGASPFSIAAADLTGDGKLDLAVANSGSDSVTTLVERGSRCAGSNPCSTNANCTSSGGGVCVDGLCASAATRCSFDADCTFSGETCRARDFRCARSNPCSTNANCTSSGGGVCVDGQCASALRTCSVDADCTVSVCVGGSNPGTPCPVGNECTGGGTCTRETCSWRGLVPSTPVPVATAPASVAVGDLNGDGRLDLAVANYNSNNVTILLGSFRCARSTPCAQDADCTGSGRICVDGRCAAAVRGCTLDADCTSPGETCRGFRQPAGSPFPVGGLPISVATGDMNGDGRLDIAVANSGANNVTILLGNGVGQFSQAAGSPVTVGTGPRSLAVADLNQDGKLDIAVANAGANNVTVLFGNGLGGFPTAATFAAGVVPVSIAVGDLNGDRRPDLAVVNYNSFNVTILLGDGAGGFRQRAGSPIAVGNYPLAGALADLSGDRKPDLAVANSGPRNVTILLNNTNITDDRCWDPRFCGADLPNGTGCDDGDRCTALDTCRSGACTGSNPAVCGADQCHDPGATCNPATGACSTPTPKPDGTQCDDNDLCTLTDLCQAGVCVGADPACPSGQCFDQTCNPTNGECSAQTLKPDGTACNDGNACTAGDACQSGECTYSTPVVCTAPTCYSPGTCDPSLGCPMPTPFLDGQPCDDGNACTANDACSHGACVGTRLDGTPCDDGNACTTQDSCFSGVCAGIPRPPPDEVSSIEVDRTGTSAVIRWNLPAGASRSDVLRGLLNTLPVGPGGGDERCADNVGESFADTENPQKPNGFWYLVRGENECHVGTYGFDGTGVERTSTTCP